MSLLFFVGACGNETDAFVEPGTLPDDPMQNDMMPDDTAGPGNDEEPLDLLEGKGIVVSGDYAGNGLLSTVDLAETAVASNVVAGVVGGDPVVKQLADQLFVLDRFGGDSVTALTRNAELLYQISLGAGSNPQDIAVVGTEAFVVNYGRATLSKFDIEANEPLAEEFADLSSLDPEDGNPDCNSIVSVGDALFVSCQLQDRSTFITRGAGVVAVVDSGSGDLIDTIELSNSNPFGWMATSSDGDILISTVPSFLDLTMGCVERIETAGGVAYAGCEVENSTLGGYANKLVFFEETGRWMAAVASSFASGRIVEETTSGWQGVDFFGEDSNPVDLQFCENGELLVSDNLMDARGLRTYAPTATSWQETTLMPLNVSWHEGFAPNNALACW